MDPTPNTASFHLPEIWHFPPERKPQFEHGFGDFATEDPVGSEQRPMNHGRKRRDMEEDLVKGVSTSNDGGNGANDDGSGVGKRSKTSGNNKGEVMVTEENSSGKHAEQTSEPPPKQDFIHVRARRGQATDSHSLAERARREKISERMKTLQDLVPGCNKVIGKALVLDEIINYIQSLHHQVEFLSMKLEAVNSRLTPGIDVFPPKDVTHFDQQTYDTSTIPFTPQATREYSRGSSPEWLHMQVGSGFERAT